jgi:hypothetical protein
MSYLDGAEEIFEQTKIRVNKRTKRGNLGWAIPPNIERVSATREKKKTPKPIATKQPPPRAKIAPAASLGRLIADYRTLVETCRARADELGISRLEIDRIGGLPSGYAGKILGKDGGEPGRKNKKIWPIAMEAMLGALGLKILLIEDAAATARTLALRTPVDRANQRFGNVCRISAKLLPPPSRTVVSGKRRGGKYG